MNNIRKNTNKAGISHSKRKDYHKKDNKELIDNYDYLSNAASTTDFTGLIPSLPKSGSELESYNDIYRFRPAASENWKKEEKKR